MEAGPAGARSARGVDIVRPAKPGCVRRSLDHWESDLTNEPDSPASTPDPARDLTEAERAELARLRAEVSQLQADASESSAGPSTATRVGGRWRVWVSALCLVVGGLLVPLSVASVWARGEVTDTNRYVQTITPLASDPGLQAAVTAKITNEVFNYLNVPALTQQAFGLLGSKGVLPQALINQLQALAGPVSDGIKGFIQTQVGKFVASSEFQTAWIEANRVAHQQLVATLTGQPTSGISIVGGKVNVNLAAVINTIKAQLVANGFSLAANIPDVNATFTIFSDPNISRVQTAYRLLNTIGLWLPFVASALFLLGVYIARSHRRAFLAAGLVVFIAAGLCSIGLALGRTSYLNAVSSNDLPRSVAATLFDTVVRFLRDGIRNAALIGLVVAAGAFLIGPSVTARRARELSVAAASATKNGAEKLGLHVGGATGWVAGHARTLRLVVTIATAAIFAVWPYRTPGVAIWLVVALCVVLFLIQIVASPVREPSTPPSSEPAVL